MSENKKVIIGGNKNESPNETRSMGFSAAEIAAMKAAGADSGQDVSGLDSMTPEPSHREDSINSQVPQEFIDDEFEIPTEIVNLPSKGVFYPGGQSQVKIKYLTADAEDIIFSPDLINSGRVLDVLLNEGIVEVLSKTVSTPGKSKIKYNKLVTARYVRQIMEIDGNRDKGYVKKFIGFMPLKDSTFLREYIKVIEPGFDFKVDLECPHCGTVHSIDVVLNPIKLFYPDANF